MDYVGLGIYPYGDSPSVDLPNYWRRKLSACDTAAQFFCLGAINGNARRVRELFQYLALLEDAPENNLTDRAALTALEQIYHLVSANKCAYGFAPGPTEQLLEQTKITTEQLLSRINDRDEGDTITLSSDSGSEAPNVDDIKQEVQDENDEQVVSA